MGTNRFKRQNIFGTPRVRREGEIMPPLPETIISSDVVTKGSYAYTAAGDQLYTVNTGIAVGSDKMGFVANSANTSLDNHGYVFGLDTGSQGWGVFYSGTTSRSRRAAP